MALYYRGKNLGSFASPALLDGVSEVFEVSDGVLATLVEGADGKDGCYFTYGWLRLLFGVLPLLDMADWITPNLFLWEDAVVDLVSSRSEVPGWVGAVYCQPMGMLLEQWGNIIREDLLEMAYYLILKKYASWVIDMAYTLDDDKGYWKDGKLTNHFHDFTAVWGYPYRHYDVSGVMDSFLSYGLWIMFGISFPASAKHGGKNAQFF